MAKYKKPTLLPKDTTFFESIIHRILKGQDYLKNPDLSFCQINDAVINIKNLRKKCKTLNSVFRVKRWVP